MKIYISPSREYDPESTVPLAGMQSKFYIPASGDFLIISVHRPRERRCTWKYTFPTRGNTIQRRQFRLRECKKNIASPRADILKLFWFPSPLEEMHKKLCIPACGNTKRTAHIRFADMQADVCSTASGTARNSVIFNTWIPACWKGGF